MDSQPGDEDGQLSAKSSPSASSLVNISISAMIVGWTIGLAALAVLIWFTLHFGDIEAFLAAIRSADPAWIAGAVICQAATYACVAATWSRTLANSGAHYRLSSLLKLAVIELFVNQALPTGGLSGSLVVVRGLSVRGISSSVAAAALLIAAGSYYTAYLTMALIAFGLLWRHGGFTDSWLATSVVFVLAVILLALSALAIARSDNRRLPEFAMRWNVAKRLNTLWAQVRIEIARNKRVLGETVFLQALVFLLDAATLYCTAQAVGSVVDFSAAFSSFMLASVVATVAPVPLGLGTFEACATTMLHVMGTSMEGALAATLILRGLTFWLPMVPGLWLLFGENRKQASAQNPPVDNLAKMSVSIDRKQGDGSGTGAISDRIRRRR